MSPERDARLLIAARGLRGLADGALVILLPAAWLAEGRGGGQIGALTTATLLGSALTTLGSGLIAHRLAPRGVLLGACALLTATGLGFAYAPSFGWLLAIAFVGTFNPSAGDVSVFLPTEQALLAAGAPERRATRFAHYNVIGTLGGVLGSYWAGRLGASEAGASAAAHSALLVYAVLGIVLAALYVRVRSSKAAPAAPAGARPLQRSRGLVARLSALFTLDSFGGGFAVQALLVAWLIERWRLPVDQLGILFGVAQALGAGSQLVSARIARRLGLIRTMVFTHVPANVFLLAMGFMPSAGLAIACLLLRASLSQMDVPARQAYVMSVVPEDERAAAASVTNVPRSFGTAFGAALAGPLLAAGAFQWALLAGGGCKLLYDALLLVGFGRRPAPHEVAVGS